MASHAIVTHRRATQSLAYVRHSRVTTLAVWVCVKSETPHDGVKIDIYDYVVFSRVRLRRVFALMTNKFAANKFDFLCAFFIQLLFRLFSNDIYIYYNICFNCCPGRCPGRCPDRCPDRRPDRCLDRRPDRCPDRCRAVLLRPVLLRPVLLHAVLSHSVDLATKK